MPPNAQPPELSDTRLAELERRITRMEAYLGIGGGGEEAANGAASPLPDPPSLRPVTLAEGEDELEFQVGQNWFALAGVIALTAGAGFLLALSYAGWPAVTAPLIGYAITAVLFSLAHFWRNSFVVVAGYLRAVAMALLCLATLRLFFPGARSVLAAGGVAGRALLLGVFAGNAAFAWRRNSPWLLGVALLTGSLAILATGSDWLLLGGIVGLAVFASEVATRRHWPALGVAAMPIAYATYLAWARGNPFFATGSRFVEGPVLAPAALLVVVGVLGLGPLRRRDGKSEDASAKVGAFVNCALGYGCFLVHTFAAFRDEFVAWQAAASLAFLALAVAFWRRWASRVTTFFYAMTGYAALSMAILKAAAAPDVFVWLSVQSVVVVTTALWFRSRLVVGANFIIYVAIVLAYAFAAPRESGISIGFGVVALISAAILERQQHRLELKTRLMRNAYLASAGLVFPYALAYLVSPRLVVVAWIALAAVYYALNILVRSRAYRWMGHATLLATSVYAVVVGTRHLEPVYRTVSFLALAGVLLAVSLAFTRARRGGHASDDPASGAR